MSTNLLRKDCLNGQVPRKDFFLYWLLAFSRWTKVDPPSDWWMTTSDCITGWQSHRWATAECHGAATDLLKEMQQVPFLWIEHHLHNNMYSFVDLLPDDSILLPVLGASFSLLGVVICTLHKYAMAMWSVNDHCSSSLPHRNQRMFKVAFPCLTQMQ